LLYVHARLYKQQSFYNKLKSVAKTAKAKVHVIDDAPTEKGKYDLLVLPDNARFNGLTEDEFSPILSEYFKNNTLGTKGQIVKGSFIFVCCHQ